jgi:hypothetical protein
MRARVLALGLAVSVSIAARPVLAVEDLTGLWEGTMKCTATDDGGTAKSKAPVAVSIAQDKGVVRLSVPGVPVFIQGFVLADPDKTDIGTVSTASCGFDSGNPNGGGVFRATVKTKVGDLKASLKATLILVKGSPDPSMSLCTITAKRTSATPGTIPPCV